MTGTDMTGTDATGTDRTGVEMIRAAEAHATEFSPPPPRPLYREVPEPEPFPAVVLGPILGPAADAIHDIIQVPYAVAAQAVLATATLGAQGCANVKLPYGSERPLSLYFAAVLGTGERKTAADDLATKPVVEREAELRIEHQQALQEYEVRAAVYDSEWSAITRNKELSPSEKRQMLSELGPKPEPPPYPMIISAEPTYEGLFRQLRQAQRSGGIFSSEGGQLIGGHAMNEENRLKTAAGLSTGWDGAPWKRVRAGDGLIVLPNRRVTLNLMMQPLVANRLLSDGLLEDQGLLSRFLVSAPSPASGTRFWKEPSPRSWEALSVYSDRVLDMLRRPPIEDDGKFPVLELTPGARELWIGFADCIERQLGPDGALSSVRGLANKAAEIAARTAGVLVLTTDPEAREISANSLSAGIDIVQFYLTEAVRLKDSGAIDADLQQAARLLRWMQVSWSEPVISLVEVYQRGPREFRQRKEAAATMEILKDYGWVAPIEGAHEVGGIRRREAYRIIRG